MPWYEVTVTASVLMAVEADSAEEATSIAYDDANFSNAGFKEAAAAIERTGEELERLKRHADEISEEKA